MESSSQAAQNNAGPPWILAFMWMKLAEEQPEEVDEEFQV